MLDERFVRPKNFDPKRHFDQSFGVMAGKGDYEVVIEMDAWLTDGCSAGPAMAAEAGVDGVAGRRLAVAAAAKLPGGDRTVRAELGGTCQRGAAAGVGGPHGEDGADVGPEVPGGKG